jgi:hypothetical protein
MVNTTHHTAHPSSTSTALPAGAILVRAYLAVVVATLATLAVLAHTEPRLATTDAWGHAIVVAVFAIVLPLRLRRAQAGKRGAIRAVGLISSVLFLVNVAEALIPGFVPMWMRVDMVLVALLMIGVVLDVIRWAVVNKD